MISLAKRRQCMGCTACYVSCPRSAISMISDEHGCKYPYINREKCIRCHYCENVCPVLNVWKPYDEDFVKSLAVQAKDQDIRYRSSSGGLFYQLGAYVIEQSGCVFGCVWRKPDIVAVHAKANTLNELIAMQQSKYVQSDLGDTLLECKNELIKGRLVLFSGTPCQIAGLNHFLGKSYQNLITIEVICHGVPMPEVFEVYKNQIEKRYGDKICGFSFRNKYVSWRDSTFVVSFQHISELILLGSMSMNPYGKAFVHNLSLRDSCFECHCKRGRSHADITIGDFWGIENILPEIDDGQGTSSAIFHTQKAMKVWEKIACKFIYNMCSIEDIEKENECYVKSVFSPFGKKSFVKKYKKCQMDILVDKCLKKSIVNHIISSVIFRIKKIFI